jgi:hypothetical protein
MKLKKVDLLDEQRVFGASPRTSLLPARDLVELELLGDWVVVTCVAPGEQQGHVAMIHGSRCKRVDPLEAPRRQGR